MTGTQIGKKLYTFQITAVGDLNNPYRQNEKTLMAEAVKNGLPIPKIAFFLM